MLPSIIGPSYNLESRPASVQRTINMVPVPLEPGNERAGWVFKDVPGLVLGATEYEVPEEAVSWNEADQSTTGTNMVLTLDGRSAQSTSSPAASRAIRCDTYRNAGKVYFEVSITGGSSIDAATPSVGIGTAATSLASIRIGTATSSGAVFLNGDGRIVTTASNPYGTTIANSTVMVAWDATLGRLWFGKDGTWFNSSNPATNTSPAATGVLGSFAPVFGASNTFGITALGRWRETDLLYGIPAGFKTWAQRAS
jgi:hypothetical protein